MKIRTITNFFNPKHYDVKTTFPLLEQFSTEIKDRFQAAGFEVQTRRLATTPFPEYIEDLSEEKAVGFAQALEAEAMKHGFQYLALGPAKPDRPESYPIIPRILAKTQNVFLGAIMATREEGVNLGAVRACARIIAETAPLSEDGFTNLRFTALANVPPGGPFFPASHHKGDNLAFALGIECADAAVRAFSSAVTIQQGRENLLIELETAGQLLSLISKEAAEKYKINFLGLDFSLAPFPEDWCSIGGAIEALGPARIGLSGSLAAAAVIADTLDMGQWPRTGFNGLFLPVLEDSILAKRASQNVLTLKDLLLFSAVCGSGLDTVPLPGDISVDQLTGILTDVAALSIRLDKPLTARLMPVPGKKAGEPTGFDFSFFANGGIMDVPAEPFSGLFARDETFLLRRRP